MEPITVSFSLNQRVLDAAIAAELPRLINKLEIDYVSGRAPKGLQATVTVNEAMIRQAVTAHARKTVNPQFTHFSIEFQATRGEDGITANVTASTSPIAEEAPSEASESVTEAEVSAAEAPAAAVNEEAPSAPEPAVASETSGTAVASEEVASSETTTASAPAAGRSRLFADMKRPDNSAEA